ncbi:hypothetical protein P8452_42035 [Trifolium repens]|nr:hypothetical protein P8452_42035 [Trifolium repens]
MVGWLNMNGTNKLLPFVGMIIAVLAQSGSMVVIKVAMKDGMNKYVMVVYSMSLSTILLLPLAFFINRSERPPLTFSALCSFFLLALMGTSGQIMTYGGIELSSPTLASAMLNLIPAFTFVLALLFRCHKTLGMSPKNILRVRDVTKQGMSPKTLMQFHLSFKLINT